MTMQSETAAMQTWIVARGYNDTQTLACLRDDQPITRKIRDVIDTAQCRGRLVEYIRRPVGVFWDGSPE